MATYRVDLEKVTFEQFNPGLPKSGTPSIIAIDQNALKFTNNNPRLTWGLGNYVAHRLFNPDLPLSMEIGIEAKAAKSLAPGLKITGAVRKSILGNPTDNRH